MPISQSDQLLQLIKSLTKAEKRNFKLYAKRTQASDSMKFIQLFDLIDKQSYLDDAIIMQGMKGVKKTHVPNLKRHLYQQIMISLRLVHISKDAGIEIREFIDFAHILYNRGLYLQSIKILDKAKTLAEKNGFDILILEIIEFWKEIESRHITRSGPGKNKALVQEASIKSKAINNTIELSNLRVVMHSYYIKFGHVRNPQDQKRVEAFFRTNMPPFSLESLGVFEKLYLYQSCVWYYYIQLDFHNCFANALKWVQLFYADQDLMRWDPDLLMRGYHYLLTSAYCLNDVVTLEKHLGELEKFRDENYPKFSTNSKIISFLYVHSSRYNLYFMNGQMEKGVKLIPRTLRRIKVFESKLDVHRILVMYYKIAWAYFCNAEGERAISYLTKIMNMKMVNLREDIQIYSRLLFLMCHYDMKNFDLMGYLIQTVSRYMDKDSDENQLQYSLFIFFKKINHLPLDKHTEELNKLSLDLETLQNDYYAKRAFIYLDALSWVRSKIKRVPIQEIIMTKNESVRSE